MLANSPAHHTQPQRASPVRGARARAEVSQADARVWVLAVIAAVVEAAVVTSKPDVAVVAFKAKEAREAVNKPDALAYTGANESYGVQAKGLPAAWVAISTVAPAMTSTVAFTVAFTASYATEPNALSASAARSWSSSHFTSPLSWLH